MARPRRMHSLAARVPSDTSWPSTGGIFSDEAETLVRVVGRNRRASQRVAAGIQLVVHGLHGARGPVGPARMRRALTPLHRRRGR